MNNRNDVRSEVTPQNFAVFFGELGNPRYIRNIKGSETGNI